MSFRSTFPLVASVASIANLSVCVVVNSLNTCLRSLDSMVQLLSLAKKYDLAAIAKALSTSVDPKKPTSPATTPATYSSRGYVFISVTS